MTTQQSLQFELRQQAAQVEMQKAIHARAAAELAIELHTLSIEIVRLDRIKEEIATLKGVNLQ